MMKSIVLFLATNILVVATISIVTSLLGLHSYLTAHGLDYRSLAIFCAIWGTAGAFISLFLSRFMAKMSMGVVLIDPNTARGEERTLLDTVYDLASRAGIKTMPEVGIYQSPELNAFATGPSKNRALVAVSSGLLQNMNRNEVAAVLGHEISHVANGDMVTLTLIQGVINAFSMFLSRIVSYAIATALSRGDDRDGNHISYLTYGLLTMVFDIVFTILGSLVVRAFSRWREFRADAGGARLTGRNNMIAALRRLGQGQEITDERAPALAAFKISHPPEWMQLFATHPPLQKRIERLEQMSTM